MEVGSHGVESFNVNREPDKAAMNFNPEVQHYGAEAGNFSVTATAPVDVTAPMASVVDVTNTSTVASGSISSTNVTTESFSFPSLTNDLNVAFSEPQDLSPSLETEEPAAEISVVTEEVHIFEVVTKESPAILQEGHFSPSVTEEVGAVSDAADIHPAIEEEMLFDDMVVLKDGMVTVAADLEENAAPVVEGANDGVDLSNLGGFTEVPAAGEVHLQQPNGDAIPTNKVLEDTVTGEFPVQQFKGDEAATEVAVETLSGEVPPEQSKANTTLLQNSHEPSGVAVAEDSLMAREMASEELQAKDSQTETAIELPTDSELPLKELPTEMTNELLAETEPTEIKQSISGSGPPIGEKPDDGTGDVQMPTNTLAPEKLSADIELEQKDEAKPEASQQEAEALKGRRVVKQFGKKGFVGEIIGYDVDSKWFKVVYEDGDEEDLEWVEVEPILVPTDIKPESLLKKRAHTGVSTDGGDERTPKKAKKYAAASPGKRTQSSKKKTPTSGKLKGKGSKKGLSTKSSAAKGKAVQANQDGKKGPGSAKKPSSSKKSKKAEGTQQLQGGSAKKSTKKKTKQKAKMVETPVKTPKKEEQKGKQQQRLVTPKGGTAVKRSKSAKKKVQEPKTPETQKVGKEELAQATEISSKSGKKARLGTGTKHSESQHKKTSQKLKSGMKRKADMDESRVSLGKRLKRVATGNTEDSAELHGGRAMQSKGGTAEVDEGNAFSDQKGVELGGGTLLVGRTTRKKFGGKYYNGKVVSFNKKTKYYKVLYDDGDEEELEWGELKVILTPEVEIDEAEIDVHDDKTVKNTPARPASGKKKSSIPQTKSKGPAYGKKKSSTPQTKSKGPASGKKKSSTPQTKSKGGKNKGQTTRNGAVTRSKGGS